MLSDERAEELREILRRRYGVELTLDQAREVGERLIRLYRAIAASSTEDQDLHAEGEAKRRIGPGAVTDKAKLVVH